MGSVRPAIDRAAPASCTGLAHRYQNDGVDGETTGGRPEASILVAQGHDALGRHAWGEALERFTEADAAGELTPAELGEYATAAWWNGQLAQAIEIRERAYGAASRANQLDVAVMLALELARDNIYRTSDPLAAAWLQRAERLLAGMDENLGHGWLAATKAFRLSLLGDVEDALAAATEAEGIAARLGDRNLAALAQAEHGFALIGTGHVPEGLAMVDEASVAAVGGELEPATAGGICCTTIGACTALGEWARAARWTEAQDRWCRREGISGYPGMCRLYRSEIKQMRGSWLEAEAEARQASVELAGFIPAAAATALYRIGAIRLRRGDLPEAEEALTQAYERGAHIEPAFSLVRLAQGRTDEAAAGISEALEHPRSTPSWDASPATPLYRMPLLRAQVEIALAAGDVDTARAASRELDGIADQYATQASRATAATARGLLRLAVSEPADAERDLREAVAAWTDLDAPYEAAQARRALAAALAARGQHERARMELRAARAAFEQLGASLDLRRLHDADGVPRGDDAGAGSDAVRALRAFVFTDIVDSTRLAETLGDDPWRGVMRWHDQAVRSVVAQHGGELVKGTGDGFFLAFDDVDRAVEAAIAIQRRLAGHREREGFAPTVRIGVHASEATRSGSDYAGRGVNLAARVCAAASGDEILMTRSSLDRSRRRFDLGEDRSLELKGLADPVGVVAVRWR
jgi:class 3 adenylate cyclase